jgi:hypothetical protein
VYTYKKTYSPVPKVLLTVIANMEEEPKHDLMISLYWDSLDNNLEIKLGVHLEDKVNPTDVRFSFDNVETDEADIEFEQFIRKLN